MTSKLLTNYACCFFVSSSNDNDDPALLSSLLKLSIRGLDIAPSDPITFEIVGREVLEEISLVYFLHLVASNDNQPTGATFLLHFGSTYADCDGLR